MIVVVQQCVLRIFAWSANLSCKVGISYTRRISSYYCT